MKWALIALAVTANAAASTLIKLAVGVRSAAATGRLWAVLGSWQMVLGLGLYGLTFVLYGMALARLPLNVAHPILTSGAVALVACASVWVVGEPFRWSTALGVALVVAGVTVIGTGAR